MDRYTHGTYSCAQHCTDGADGGRCDDCKDAYTEYMREWRLKNPEKMKKEKERNAKRGRAMTILAQRHAEELRHILEEMG